MNITPTPRFQERELCAVLDKANISYSYHEHAPVFSVNESKLVRDTLPEGADIKNLFLKDRKSNFFLLSVMEDRRINLKELSKVLGAKGGLSFAREELLWHHLGVKPGSVTPYAILNAAQGCIRQFFDEELFNSSHFLAHPLRNDRTIAARTPSVLLWLNHQGYPIERLDFSSSPPHIKVIDYASL